MSLSSRPGHHSPEKLQQGCAPTSSLSSPPQAKWASPGLHPSFSSADLHPPPPRGVQSSKDPEGRLGVSWRTQVSRPRGQAQVSATWSGSSFPPASYLLPMS